MLRRGTLPLAVLLLAVLVAWPPPVLGRDQAGPYSAGPASRDGIGKRFLGREIAKVMGHRGARWLERESREAEEATDRLIAALPLQPADHVADIGAGTGYFAFRLAPLVDTVFAVDIQPEMLNFISYRMKEQGIDNVIPVRGDIDDPNLAPDTIDLALLVDAYHEFSHPLEMLTALRGALKPGAVLALVEYRAEDPTVPIKPLHKMTEAQAKAELAFAGFRWLETRDLLPRQHLMLFESPD